MSGDKDQDYTALQRTIAELTVENERLKAEVSVLRGVECEANGDGPCGACIKCYRADKQRMDWLDDRATYVGSSGCGGVYQWRARLDTEMSFRAAIDDARKETLTA